MKKYDLRPMMRAQMVKDYGEKAGKAFDRAQTGKPQKVRAPVASESQEQIAVCQWWASYCRTKGLDERLLFAVPNGGHLAGDSKQRAIQMARMKREGLRPGAPDLILAKVRWANLVSVSGVMQFAGLYIELKSKTGKLSKEQIEFAALLRHQGYNAICCVGADEAIRAIKAYIET